MTSATRFLLAIALAWPMTLATVAWAESDAEREAAKAEAREADLADARAEIQRASAFLGSQTNFRFEAHLGYDVLQGNGQMLEFGGQRDVLVRRPDRIRIESRTRDGEEKTLFFDGTTISIDLPADAAYVAVDRPGSLDAAIDYLVDDLKTPAPLADLLHSNFYGEIAEAIQSGFIVGLERIGKYDALHVAVRTESVDAQLWFQDGDRPVPVRIVISYKNAEGQPQFWAQFTEWELDVEAKDEQFVYTPPDGAELIPISVAVREAKEEAPDTLQDGGAQ